MNPNVLAAFSGKAVDYPRFNQKAISFMIEVGEGTDPQGLGLLHAFATPEFYAAHPRPDGIVAAVFVPRPDPGPRPDVPVFANQLAAMEFALDQAQHDHVKTSHTKEQSALVYAKKEYIKAIPALILEEICDPVHEFRQQTLRQIHAHMDARFLTLSPTDLSLNHDLLLAPFDPSSQSVVDYMALMRDVHATQLRNNNAVPEARKVLHLIQGLLPSGLYNLRIEIWTTALPLAAQQTFALLATAIREFEKNRAITATAKTAGFSAALVPATASAPVVHPDPAVAALIASQAILISGQTTANAAIAGIQTILQGGGGGGGKGKKGGGGGGAGGGGGGGGAGGGGGGGGARAEPIYCWSHGCLGHASSICTHPKVGHQVTATYYNQMKGKKA